MRQFGQKKTFFGFGFPHTNFFVCGNEIPQRTLARANKQYPELKLKPLETGVVSVVEFEIYFNFRHIRIYTDLPHPNEACNPALVIILSMWMGPTSFSNATANPK
jgi:hypothetical protein